MPKKIIQIVIFTVLTLPLSLNSGWGDACYDNCTSGFNAVVSNCPNITSDANDMYTCYIQAIDWCKGCAGQCNETMSYKKRL